jgi:hypothetical protein
MMNAYYNSKIHTDPDFYGRGKKGVAEYVKNRYNTDEEFKGKRNQYCLNKMKEL